MNGEQELVNGRALRSRLISTPRRVQREQVGQHPIRARHGIRQLPVKRVGEVRISDPCP